MTALIKTIRTRTRISTAIVILLVGILATVAAAMNQGIHAGRENRSASNSAARGSVRGLPTVDIANGAAGVPLRAPNSGNPNILQTYTGPGPVQPGTPPFGQLEAGGDGLSILGVAFKKTTDANAQADASLIKSAFQDAQKKADELASAAGLKLGKLVAISDYTEAKPYYDQLCAGTQPGSTQAGPPLGLPLAEPNGTTGTGTVVPSGPPQPVPTPCQEQRYLVAWVLLRYQIS